MYFRALTGVLAGLSAGVVAAIMNLVMTIRDADGFAVPLLTVIARAVGYNDAGAGWSFYMLNAGLAGLLFGVLFGGMAVYLTRALVFGLIMGIFWWFVSALIVLPAQVAQQSTFSAEFAAGSLNPVFLGTLISAVVFGLLLGATYLFIYEPVHQEELYDRQRELDSRRSLREPAERAS